VRFRRAGRQQIRREPAARFPLARRYLVPPGLEAMPERQYFSGADTGNGFSQADYDQMGMPRTYNTVTAGDSTQGSAATAPAGGGSTGSSAAHQITVNVQAMDAQSFLDHSNDIAQAVRQAMLNLSSINDVVNEL
jgi:hypothetical protein